MTYNRVTKLGHGARRRHTFQARAAEELAMMPDGSAIVEMMDDYAVMRDQVEACT